MARIRKRLGRVRSADRAENRDIPTPSRHLPLPSPKEAIKHVGWCAAEDAMCLLPWSREGSR